jgi:hypothetical protein
MSNTTVQSRTTSLRARLRRVWHEQWGSQGLEAAGAALAAAIILGALLLMAPTVGERVERALSCAASVLSGGGGCAGGSSSSGGSAPTTGDAPTTTQDGSEGDDDCGFFCQVGGFFKGIGEGAVDFVVGIKDLAVDAYGLITGDPETVAKYEQLIQAFQDDPLGTLKAIGEAVIAPIVEDWQNGRYGEAIGRGFFEVITTVVGDKGIGKLGKLGKVDDIARGTTRTDDVLRGLDNIPCVGYVVPLGRGAGLAAPLLEGCARGPRAAETARRAEQASIDAARRLGGDIDYGRLDSLNRPTGIEATITPEMIAGDIGTHANGAIRPPGFEGGPSNHARGHLLGRQLGGSGHVDSNLVTLFQNPVNTPIMSGIEAQVRAAVEAGETVRYRVTPIYDGDNPIPTQIRIQADGDDGFHLDVTIDNVEP